MTKTSPNVDSGIFKVGSKYYQTLEIPKDFIRSDEDIPILDLPFTTATDVFKIIESNKMVKSLKVLIEGIRQKIGGIEDGAQKNEITKEILTKELQKIAVEITAKTKIETRKILEEYNLRLATLESTVNRKLNDVQREVSSLKLEVKDISKGSSVSQSFVNFKADTERQLKILTNSISKIKEADSQRDLTLDKYKDKLLNLATTTKEIQRVNKLLVEDLKNKEAML